jgi:AmmeMemoRadiSam system protein A
MRSPDQVQHSGPELLRLARASVEYGAIHDESLPVDCEALPRALRRPGATFTTLRLEGQLRGCCGSIEATNPLAVDAAGSAFRAAYRDPRFDPIGPHEIEALHLEVSVLMPLEAIAVSSETDLLDQLTPCVHGLVLTAGPQRATFLPKVWESLPDPYRFVAALKVKCGLPGDSWSDDFKFYRYQTVSFTEPC